MHKIFTILRQLLSRLLERDRDADPLAGMSPRQLADLPPVHSDRDRCVC